MAEAGSVVSSISGPRDLPRTIGFWGGVSVMIGVIIGSGIFGTPTDIAKCLGSPALVLLFWLLGGLIALAGALTYSELISMFPQSGGIYVFLREGYGRPMAFVFGWTYLLIVKPSAAAGITVLFGSYLNQLLGTDWSNQAITIVIVVGLTIINVLGTTLSTRFAMALTGVKFAALLLIVAAGLLMQKGAAANFQAHDAPRTLLESIIPVMAAVMWTYDGWSDAGAIAGEIRDPQRTLPRIFLIGTIVITGLYLAVNAVYIYMIPLAEQASTGTLAPVVMNRLLGSAGGIAVTVIVLISTLGSSHASIMTGARVTYQQSRDGLLFEFLGHISPRFQTPAISLWAQCILSCAAVMLLETFGKLTGTFVFTMWIFYGLAGITIFIFRVKRPDADRPFRCIGYPWVPGLFVAVSLAMTVLSIWQDARSTLPWIGLLIVGFPVYYLWEALRGKKNNGPDHSGPLQL